jgi:hypothetical protein
VYVSLDDGDNWQPLQLNLPVTSMRDFEIYGNDLIVGTHGRGIWVIDDISALRQLTPEVLQADAFLFKPSDAFNYVQGDDNGTPTQKDEPQAENPPSGAFIDYYLKAASASPVTLEILDAGGKVVHTFSSTSTAPAAGRGRQGGGGIPRVSPLWVSALEQFSAAAGVHRAVWNPVLQIPAPPGVDGGQGRIELLTGAFSAKLSVNGKNYTETFTVKPDPRM